MCDPLLVLLVGLFHKILQETWIILGR